MKITGNKFYVLGTALLMTAVSFAQVPVTSSSAPAAATPIEGTPYLNDTYADGEIYFATSRRQAPVRYNIYQDLMEYKVNGQLLVLDPNTSVKKVRFDNTIFVVDKVDLKGSSKYSYLTVIDSGKVTLLAKKLIMTMEAKKGGALDGTDLPARYKRLPDMFFVKVGNGTPAKVESIKSMIALFPDKQEELTQFAKKEKISPRKEAELKKLVQYYNSL